MENLGFLPNVLQTLPGTGDLSQVFFLCNEKFRARPIGGLGFRGALENYSWPALSDLRMWNYLEVSKLL